LDEYDLDIVAIAQCRTPNQKLAEFSPKEKFKNKIK
jgi:hypothetical protein